MKSYADFSGDRKYRYSLTRTWGERPEFMCNFIGLKPSLRADENTDDPSVKACVRFAKSWGFHSVVMTSLFAYRKAKSDEIPHITNPVGVLNDLVLKNAAHQSQRVVAVWGRYGKFNQRDAEIIRMIPNLTVLQLTDNGYPVSVMNQDKKLLPVHWKQASVQYRFCFRSQQRKQKCQKTKKLTTKLRT